MTLDEAIQHAEEVAKEQDKLCKRYDDASGYTRSHNEDIRTNDAKKCSECAENHRQLAMWLCELRLYRMHGTVAQIDGKWYVADDPKLKTVHGKTGEVVIGGFKEVEE